MLQNQPANWKSLIIFSWDYQQNKKKDILIVGRKLGKFLWNCISDCFTKLIHSWNYISEILKYDIKQSTSWNWNKNSKASHVLLMLLVAELFVAIRIFILGFTSWDLFTNKYWCSCRGEEWEAQDYTNTRRKVKNRRAADDMNYSSGNYFLTSLLLLASSAPSSAGI